MTAGRSRALFTFGIAHQDAEEWTALAVTSREMLAVERQLKGFSTNRFFTDITIAGLYRIGHIVLRIRGEIDRSLSFDDFVGTYDVKLGDPSAEREQAPADDEEFEHAEGDEEESAGPTPPTA